MRVAKASGSWLAFTTANADVDGRGISKANSHIVLKMLVANGMVTAMVFVIFAVGLAITMGWIYRK